MSKYFYCVHHTKCMMGDTDVHTMKWKVNFSNLSVSNSSVKLNWTQPAKTNIQLNYIHRQNSSVELFLSYSDNFSKMSIRTMQRFKSNNQNVIIQESPIECQHISIIDGETLLFDTIIIQIDITHNKDTYSTMPNLYNLLAEPSYFDCTIESCDGVMFKIHKCVLATRSDVFKAHFTHSEESSIIQTSFTKDVLKQLLNFIYSGMEAFQMDSVADRLFVAADFYHLNDLKSFCEYYLYKWLSEENVIETLEFADLHSAVNLKNFAMDFILCHANVVLNTHAWANIKSPEILKALCMNAMSN